MDGSKALADLREHAALLREIQDKVFAQIERGRITDDFVAEAGAEGEIMPRVFAIESALAALGSLTSVADKLAGEKSHYAGLEDVLKRDSVLRDLSVKFISPWREDHFATLYKKEVQSVLSFVEQIQTGAVQPKPYGEFVDFDMEVWALACLLDIKDVFFRGRISKEIVTEGNDVTEKIDDLVSVGLSKLAQEGQEGINSVRRIGWYGSVEIMKRLREVRSDIRLQAELRRRNDNIAKAFREKNDNFDDLLRDLIDIPAVIETTLVSTRAVCIFIAIAQDVLKAQGTESAHETEKTKEFFDYIERQVLGNDEFGLFWLKRLKHYLSISRLDLEDVDAFIHLTGMLAFALSRGYFSQRKTTEGDVVAKSDELRENLKESGFQTRTEVIEAILGKYETDVLGALNLRTSSLYETPNRYIATADLSRLYDADGRPKALKRIEDKVAIEEENRRAHSFEYFVAVPIAVKALSQLALEERLARMTNVNCEEWKNLDFPRWLAKAEELVERIVTIMIDVHVSKERDKAPTLGVWGKRYDWSVTAAVVDALSLWCGSLVCHVALNAQVTGIAPETGPTGGLSGTDQTVMQEFLKLVSKYAARQLQLQAPLPALQPPAPSGARANETGNSETLEWLTILRRVSDPALNFDPQDPERSTTRGLGLENSFKIVALVQHIRRELGQSASVDSIVSTVCDQIREVLQLPKLDAASMFGAVYEKIRGKFPDAFSQRESGRRKAKQKPAEQELS